MVSVPILCLHVNVVIGIVLKFDANAEVNAGIDGKCDQTSTEVICVLSLGYAIFNRKNNRGIWFA